LAEAKKSNDDNLMIIGFSIFLSFMLFFLIFNFKYNKCPKCKVIRGKHPGKFCKNCGAQFDYDAEI